MIPLLSGHMVHLGAAPAVPWMVAPAVERLAHLEAELECAVTNCSKATHQSLTVWLSLVVVLVGEDPLVYGHHSRGLAL